MLQSPALWHPETSVRLQPSADESEEGGRSSLVDCKADGRTKKKSHGIARRRTPTLDLSAAVASKERDKDPARHTEPSEKLYQTIETRSEQGLLDYSLKSFGKQENTLSNSTDLCGWQDAEHLGPGKHSSASTVSERLQTPADGGQRSNLHSRAGSSRNSSRYGRRQDHYEFRHLSDAHEYMDNYRRMYCFTTLSVPPQGRHITEEEVPQHDDGFMPVGVKSLYRCGDPYLKELALRLGVRESIREQQLLHPPRKTPPSIVKKNSSHSDLFVCSAREEEDADTNTPLSEETFKKDPLSLPLELPRIAQSTQIRSTNKSGSSISVTKYLQVSSPKQESEDKNVNVPSTIATQDTANKLASTSSEDIHLEKADNGSQGRGVKQPEDCITGEIEFSPRSTKIAQDQLYTLDSAQKEKRISQKAQALGLISRGWAKAPNAKTLFGSRIPNSDGGHRYTRQGTKPAADDAKDNAGPITAAMEDKKTESLPSKPVAKQRQVDTQKLEKLKSIYDSTSRSHSEKSHNAKCERKSMSRPITRLSNRAELQDLKYKRSQSYSRPITRLEKSDVRVTKAKLKETELQCLEESSYWNELPQPKIQLPLKSRPKETPARKYDEVTVFAKVDSTSKPSRKPRKGLHHHTVALTMKTKRPPLLLQQSGSSSITEPIPPGSGPKQIMDHLTRMRKKLDGVLGIQQHKFTH